jgi:hypothetical protein
MKDIDIDLMIFSLRNYNEQFLKHCLHRTYFTAGML